MDGFLFALLLVATAAGFFLGRCSSKSQSSPNRLVAHDPYLEGLKHLLNDQTDAAIDALITALEVNQHTVEMYFSLGALWRRKGEMDRAIRLHQALLSNPKLTSSQMQQAQLELALDYTHSGLLDRGEVLLKELADTASPVIQLAAGRELVLLYQEEGDWKKAIAAVNQFCDKSREQDNSHWRHMQVHYYCELAEDALAAPDWSQSDLSIKGVSGPPEAVCIAKQWLQQSALIAPDHPRALLLRSLLALGEKDEGASRDALRSIKLEPGLCMAAVPLMATVIGWEEDVWQRISDLYQKTRDVGLIPYLAESLYRKHGSQAAIDFIVQELLGQEGQQPIAQLIDVAGPLHYESVRPVLREILPFCFTCTHCGFQGRRFYWACPGCKTWL
ncbi:MAG: hypothetical protein NVV73_20830 [Cellvibrionaceae bacterium]|nr:hypothetical protein [Cellvibrionaceae bacterium]